jgi:hypothetical protein
MIDKEIKMVEGHVTGVVKLIVLFYMATIVAAISVAFAAFYFLACWLVGC